MNSMDWTGVIFGMGVLILGTILTVVILTQVGAFSRARVARREEERYLELVGRYEALLDESNKTQSNVTADLAEVRSKVTEIERLLREVE